MRPKHATFPLGESRIVVSPFGDSLVILNSTARLIWEMFAQGQAPDVVIDRFTSRFGIPREKARKDVDHVHRLWSSNEFPLRSQEESEFQSNLNGINLSLDALERDRQPVSQRVYALSDVSFSIRFHSAEIESILQSVLGHLEKTTPAPSHVFEVLVEDSGYCLRKDGIEVGRETSPHSLRHDLVYEIAKISYPGLEWLVFMHAGAISDGERCVVLPGLPGCGKSTLTAALILKGFHYVGEDIVPLSRQPLSVVPVPTRICLREGGWQALSQDYPDVQVLPGGCRWGKQLRYLTPPGNQVYIPRQLPVHCLVFPEYAPGQAIQMSTVTSEDKLARLIQTGAWFNDSLNEQRIEELLEWIQATPGYQLRYGDLHDAVATVSNLLHK